MAEAHVGRESPPSPNKTEIVFNGIRNIKKLEIKMEKATVSTWNETFYWLKTTRVSFILRSKIENRMFLRKSVFQYIKFQFQNIKFREKFFKNQFFIYLFITYLIGYYSVKRIIIELII